MTVVLCADLQCLLDAKCVTISTSASSEELVGEKMWSEAERPAMCISATLFM